MSFCWVKIKSFGLRDLDFFLVFGSCGDFFGLIFGIWSWFVFMVKK